MPCHALLRAAGCKILVCLSHTGLLFGDKELADAGLYDVLFSGHEHYKEGMEALPQVNGPGGRLGLFSQGMANGLGLCWAKLTLDRRTGEVLSHESGITPLLGPMPTDEELNASKLKPLLEAWRGRFEPIIQGRVGTCACDIAPPTDNTKPSAYFNCPLHHAMAHAVTVEFLHQLGIEWPDGLLFIQNHYSMVRDVGVEAGPIRHGQVTKLLQFANPMALVELSGAFIAAIVRHNALYVGRGDFMVISGIEDAYVLRDGEGPVPETLTKADAMGGAVMAKHPCIGGRAVEEGSWYPVLVGEYQLDTTLGELPERAEGTRNRRTLEVELSMAQLVIASLKRGQVLDVVTHWGRQPR
jgi:2',3'-cyclic-nucleotide 2'-phosphodiesterase (5'-nucleotidase family)